MSFVHHHTKIETLRIVPFLVQDGGAMNTTVLTNYIANFTNPPQQGNLIVAWIAGPQGRGITLPTGWFNSGVDYTGGAGAGGTNEIMYKIAGPSEPTSYAFAITGGSLTGNGRVMEVGNIDAVSPIMFGGGYHENTTVTTTKPIPAGYNVYHPAFALANIQTVAAGAPSWNPNLGFTLNHISGSSNAAYKIYTTQTLGEILTWTGNATASPGTLLALFQGKSLN